MSARMSNTRNKGALSRKGIISGNLKEGMLRIFSPAKPDGLGRV
jgi:hypothetical protein